MKDSGIRMLCMENVIMRLRCPKRHHFLINHALCTMFNHFIFKWNGLMIPTWLAHGTEHMQLRMQREFSGFLFLFLFCWGKCKDHAWKQKVWSLQNKKYVECICMMMQWLMQNVMLEYDNGQMQERYVHYDALKRCLCDAWYECIYGHKRPKNHIFLLAHWGAKCPMCTVKKVIWTFRLPVTKDETNIQCMCDNMMQMCKSVTRGCT